MKNLTIGLVILSGFFSVFSIDAQDTSESSLVAEGAKLYSENCGRCHNARPASDYTKREWSVVMPHMREKAHMTGTESIAVEAFIASTLTADVRNNMTTNGKSVVERSGEVLVKQFGCQGCHMLKGVGGTMGPALDNVVDTKGRDYVLKKLRDPKFDNAASAMPQFPMSDKELQSIIEFMSKD